MGHKILLIDDDELIRRLISFNLGRAGYDVETCQSGPIGVVKAKEVFPDLIILDRMMPLMDGFEVAEKIREDNELKDIPLIMLTASETNVGDIQKAHDLKLAGYLKKASDMTELIERVGDFFEKEEKKFLEAKSGPLSFYQRKQGAVIILPFYSQNTVPRLEETIEYLTESNIKNMVLDLTRVDNIDDFFLESISGFRDLQLGRLGDIKLHLKQPISRSLETLLQSKRLSYYHSIKEALDDFIDLSNDDFELNLDI